MRNLELGPYLPVEAIFRNHETTDTETEIFDAAKLDRLRADGSLESLRDCVECNGDSLIFVRAGDGSLLWHVDFPRLPPTGGVADILEELLASAGDRVPSGLSAKAREAAAGLRSPSEAPDPSAGAVRKP